MTPFRIALANIRFPATPEESVALARSRVFIVADLDLDLATGLFAQRYKPLV